METKEFIGPSVTPEVGRPSLGPLAPGRLVRVTGRSGVVPKDVPAPRDVDWAIPGGSDGLVGTTLTTPGSTRSPSSTRSDVGSGRARDHGTRVNCSAVVTSPRLGPRSSVAAKSEVSTAHEDYRRRTNVNQPGYDGRGHRVGIPEGTGRGHPRSGSYRPCGPE